MDIQKVNEVLSKARLIFQEDEAQALAGLVEDDDYEGDDASAIEGGVGGVDNLSSAVEAFDSYIEDLVMGLVARQGVSEESAIDAFVGLADELAQKGKLPELPDDDASDSMLSGWIGAAQQAGFGGLLMTYCGQMNGQDPTRGGTADHD